MLLLVEVVSCFVNVSQVIV